MTAPAWRRSSRCESTTCVEVAHTPTHVLVRDSKAAGGPTLWFEPGQWAEFTAGVKLGEFDRAGGQARDGRTLCE